MRIPKSTFCMQHKLNVYLHIDRMNDIPHVVGLTHQFMYRYLTSFPNWLFSLSHRTNFHNAIDSFINDGNDANY